MTEKEFEENFLRVFANDITEKQLKKFRIGKKYKGYLWLLFNRGLVSCYEGDAARLEYNSANKTGAMEVLYNSSCVRGGFDCSVLDTEHLMSKGVDDAHLDEFYIIGKDFSWCYVVTHEGDLAGPYFCYAPKKSFYELKT